MDLSFMPPINYMAVVAASVMFFVVGSIWFSFLFSGQWTRELKRHNVSIKQPANNEMYIKMLLTFAANYLACLCMAYLVEMTGSSTTQSGLILGSIAALGFAFTAIGSVFIWENRSLKLFLIDVGYPVVGIIAAAVMLSVWH